MFTQDEYLWAWGFYLLGAGLVMAVWWVITAKLPWSEPKVLLRVLLAVLLVAPWYTDADGVYLSPAWIIGLAERAFEGPDAFWRAGMPLVTALMVALILSCAVYIGLWFRARKAAHKVG